jgi:hypothetical protein
MAIVGEDVSRVNLDSIRIEIHIESHIQDANHMAPCAAQEGEAFQPDACRSRATKV